MFIMEYTYNVYEHGKSLADSVFENGYLIGFRKSYNKCKEQFPSDQFAIVGLYMQIAATIELDDFGTASYKIAEGIGVDEETVLKWIKKARNTEWEELEKIFGVRHLYEGPDVVCVKVPVKK